MPSEAEAARAQSWQAAHAQADDGRFEPRVLSALRAAGWVPGRALEPGLLEDWEDDMAALSRLVPAVSAHPLARAAVSEFGGLHLEVAGTPPVLVYPADEHLDPEAALTASREVDEALAPIALVADGWPTTVVTTSTGRTLAVRGGRVHPLGPDVVSGLTSLLLGPAPDTGACRPARAPTAAATRSTPTPAR